MEVLDTVSPKIIDTGLNVISASAAVKIDNYTLVYTGLIKQNGDKILTAVSCFSNSVSQT